VKAVLWCDGERNGAAAKDGTYIRFDDNAAVLINDAGETPSTQ